MMYSTVDFAVQAALVAFLVAAVAAPFTLGLLRKAGSRQKVSEHVPEHASKQGTPTMGGLIVLLGLAAAMAFVPSGERAVPIVLLVGFALIGFVDDFVVPRWLSHTRGLGWKQKFVLQAVVAAGAYWLGGARDPWAMAFLVVVVMFFANAFNFSDGMDSLAGGLAVMMAIGFAVIGRMSMADQPAEQAVLVMMAATAAAFVPFLFLNAPPAKVFMGDVCALPVGALLGWAFLAVGRSTELVPGRENLWAAIIISLVMVVELVPVPLQIASVKLRKGKRLFPRTPIHHAFQSAGWPETRVVWTFHLVQFVLVAVALGFMWRVAG